MERDIERWQIVAVGSRSVVRACGVDMVAKVPIDSTPSAWIQHEAEFTSAVWALGVPAHRPFGVREHDGTLIGIYERIDGPTLWSLIVKQPRRAAHYGALLAELHARVISVTPPVSLPRQSDRIRCKLRRAGSAYDARIAEAASQLPAHGVAPRLCHGDFHPGNVIMSPVGPVVVDWFDACRGDAAADVARTSLLLGIGGASSERLQHLPGHTVGILRDLHEAYMSAALDRLSLDLELVDKWRRIEALARLAEVAEHVAMFEMWSGGRSQAERVSGA